MRCLLGMIVPMVLKVPHYVGCGDYYGDYDHKCGGRADGYGDATHGGSVHLIIMKEIPLMLWRR